MALKWALRVVAAAMGSSSRKGRGGEGLHRPANFFISLYHMEELVVLS